MAWEIPTDQRLSHWNRANAENLSSGTTLTLPAYGALIPITLAETSTIEGIVIPSGLPTEIAYDVDLLLPANITIVHLSGTPGTGAVAIRLAGAANIVTTHTIILPLHYDGTYWSERDAGTFYLPPLVGPSGATAVLSNYWPVYVAGAVVGYVPFFSSAGTNVGASPVGSAGGILTGTYPNPDIKDFVASGASHAHGAVPDPGAVSGTANYLREDGTWAVPPGTGGGSAPSGTGFVHVTAGVQDGASKLVDTADVNADQITWAKIQNIATDSLAGRDTAGTGDLEAIAVGGGIEFTGAGAIQTTAFTGDVTKAAGGTVTTLAVAPFAVVQTSLGTASSAVDFNGQEVRTSAAPVGANDLVNKTYADAIASGLSPKGNVRALSDSDIASLSGLGTTVDGVALSNDSDRVLLAGQTTATQNGIYLVHSGAWTRSADMAGGSNAAGAYCFIQEGTLYANLGFICTNSVATGVVGVNNLTFQQFSGAGQINAGAGLTKTGNTLNVVANADASIVVNADDVKVGVLATDAQHGVRGGGTQHATFVQSGASHATGFVPDPGASAGTTKFLREDATWVVPPAGAWTDVIKDVGKGWSGTFDITGLSGLTTDKNVAVMQTEQIIPTKGNARDEMEFDAIIASGYVFSATTIRVRWRAPGIVVGDYAFAYQVGG